MRMFVSKKAPRNRDAYYSALVAEGSLGLAQEYIDEVNVEALGVLLEKGEEAYNAYLDGMEASDPVVYKLVVAPITSMFESNQVKLEAVELTEAIEAMGDDADLIVDLISVDIDGEDRMDKGGADEDGEDADMGDESVAGFHFKMS